jgi:hypothetical protein
MRLAPTVFLGKYLPTPSSLTISVDDFSELWNTTMQRMDGVKLVAVPSRVGDHAGSPAVSEPPMICLKTKRRPTGNI